MRWLPTALFSCALLPAYVTAQNVRGVVREADSRTPVRGAFVTLRDPDGRTRVGVLTDAEGRYVMRAPSLGSYQLRAERIGYDSTATPTFELAFGQTETVDLALKVAPLRLSEVAIRGGSKCQTRPQSAAETARVWEEARKALTVAAWVGSDTTAHYRVRQFVRALNSGGKPTGEDTIVFGVLHGKAAFAALSADSLVEKGFVRPAGDAALFYGPDAYVLTANAFLSQHCFKLERKKDRPGLIGLSFEPLRGRGLTDIEGTLWLDEQSGALRFIEYGFTGLSGNFDRRVSGGRTDFEQLQNGAWIVRYWELRMPDVRTLRRRPVLVGGRSVGAEVLDTELPDGSTFVFVPSYPVRGIAYDSVSARPLENATVFLEGTPFKSASNERGEFTIERVPAGPYTLRVAHPRLDSIPGEPPNAQVVVKQSAVQRSLVTPSARTLLSKLCSKSDLSRAQKHSGVPMEDLGVLQVHIVTGDDANPVRGLEVLALYGAAASDSLAAANAPRQRTDVNGTATLCGIPKNIAYVLALKQNETMIETKRATFPRDGVLQLTLKLSEK